MSIWQSFIQKEQSEKTVKGVTIVLYEVHRHFVLQEVHTYIFATRAQYSVSPISDLSHVRLHTEVSGNSSVQTVNRIRRFHEIRVLMSVHE
jgi:hypothetical protein